MATTNTCPVADSPDKGMMPPNHTTRCQAITDIIESVAQQQKALSKILDAEGEKLEKVIGMHCADPCKLLEVNRSVEQTIRAIVQLENILLGKLQLFSDCLCPWSKQCSDCWDR